MGTSSLATAAQAWRTRIPLFTLACTEGHALVTCRKLVLVLGSGVYEHAEVNFILRDKIILKYKNNCTQSLANLSGYLPGELIVRVDMAQAACGKMLIND